MFYLKQLFLTKTAEHDLSLTSITFDLEWPRANFFQRMRRIDARRGTENIKALFPTKFELLAKNQQEGPLGPPIRSRVKTWLRIAFPISHLVAATSLLRHLRNRRTNHQLTYRCFDATGPRHPGLRYGMSISGILRKRQGQDQVTKGHYM